MSVVEYPSQGWVDRKDMSFRRVEQISFRDFTVPPYAPAPMRGRIATCNTSCAEHQITCRWCRTPVHAPVHRKQQVAIRAGDSGWFLLFRQARPRKMSGAPAQNVRRARAKCQARLRKMSGAPAQNVRRACAKCQARLRKVSGAPAQSVRRACVKCQARPRKVSGAPARIVG